MKGIKQLFAVLLAPLAFQPVALADMADVARATARNDAPATVSATRKKNAPDVKESKKTTARTTSSVQNSKAVRDRTTTRGDTASVRINEASDSQKSVSARTSANIVARPAPSGIPTRTISSRNTNTTSARTTARATNTPRIGIARNASTANAASVLSRNYGKCRDVFNSCMDEFCANKDANLGRCACSVRATEFENTKKNLAQVEDKLLEFGERLLMVNMDAQDINAMNQATAGEVAFADEDKSESKKLLDKIAKKLNTSFDDSNFDNKLNAINLSLNTDAAFDSVDSMMGASTTTKSGAALYGAALPICREMAAEVCSPDELSIAESGYQMIIEQDCNTVAKTYQNQTEQARSKVLESSALLDMSRLDIYQQRNSDDILTCKGKMLDMLADSTVCGENLEKCLDVSGKYIDPTTGDAFLTNDLYELSTLLTRPSSGISWTSVPGNDKFVTFLNTKKSLLEPAMENCQDISDHVWDEFIEDALAQIKLAQNQKLETIRQSCTTLTTQCLDDAMDSITKFDTRALSVFGVLADKTVNAMCADIRNACTALMNNSFDDESSASAWGTGMTQIANKKTYETILSTCRAVGRQCIIDTCTSTSGNFGLCQGNSYSINRASIIKRDACWDDVENCVRNAGIDTLAAILSDQNRTPTQKSGNRYTELYGYTGTDTNTPATQDDTPQQAQTSVYDWCSACTTTTDCAVCRLTEEIWGNCAGTPSYDTDNTILTPTDSANETLLSWFAKNTGTKGNECFAGTCPPSNTVTSDGQCCATSNTITITDNITNCAAGGKDTWGNGCNNTATTINATVYYSDSDTTPTIIGKTVCAPSSQSAGTQIASYTDDTKTHNIICFGTVTNLTCDGTLVQITVTANDTNATYQSASGKNIAYYKDADGKQYADAERWIIDYNNQDDE